jgi:hypothetical protein
MNLSLVCEDDDGAVVDLEDEDRGEDQRVSSYFPDLFFSICG